MTLDIRYVIVFTQLFSTGVYFVAAVTVFAVNNDAVCGFLPHICAVLRFFNPPYAPLLIEEINSCSGVLVNANFFRSFV